jgi:hypothetical protein
VNLDERDPVQWAIVCAPDEVVYAQRPTREEAEDILGRDASLIRHFGHPRIEPPKVIPFPASKGESNAHPAP